MAYSRFGKNCDYYIFWYEESNDETNRKENEKLAIWHADHRADGPIYTYEEVKNMLKNSNFSKILGYKHSHKEFLEPLLNEFLADVDDEYTRHS